jgi:heme/copper-type cytochrome/quinol oxidase subunit 1
MTGASTKRGLAIAGAAVLAIGLLWTLTQPWAGVTYLLFGPPRAPSMGWTIYAPLSAPKPWPLDPRLAIDIAIAASAFFVAAPLLIILRDKMGRKRPFALDLTMLWIAGTIVLAAACIAQVYAMQRLQRDVVLQDTYYIVLHVRHVLRICAAFVLFASFYHWFPHITGLKTSKVLGQTHFWLTLAGTVAAVYAAPLMLAAYGLPHRYTDYPGTFDAANRVTTIGLDIAGAGLVVFVVVLMEAVMRGRRPATLEGSAT